MASKPHTPRGRQDRINLFHFEAVCQFPVALRTSGQANDYYSNLDWVGSVICLGLSTCVVLGLTWGGAVKPWKSFDVIFPLALAGVLIIMFLLWEKRQGDQALVPVSLFSRRTHTGACLEGVRSFFYSYTPIIAHNYC